MELKQKIVFTLLFIAGFFIRKAIAKLNNNGLKRRLEVINPALVKKTPWFFSEGKLNIMDWIFGIMIFVLLLLIWSNIIVIPLKKEEYKSKISKVDLAQTKRFCEGISDA